MRSEEKLIVRLVKAGEHVNVYHAFVNDKFYGKCNFKHKRQDTGRVYHAQFRAYPRSFIAEANLKADIGHQIRELEGNKYDS